MGRGKNTSTHSPRWPVSQMSSSGWPYRPSPDVRLIIMQMACIIMHLQVIRCSHIIIPCRSQVTPTSHLLAVGL